MVARLLLAPIPLTLFVIVGCGPQVIDLDGDNTPGGPDPTGSLQQPGAPELFVLEHQHGDYFLPPAPDASSHALGFLADAPQPRARVVYLAVDGEQLTRGGWAADNAQANTTFLLQSDEASVPAFDHAPWAEEGQDRAQVLGDLLDQLKFLFAPFEVRFVTERPPAGDYTMIVLGGAPSDIGLTFEPAGVAPLDPDDRNANDVGFVFSAVIEEAGYTTARLATFVAHELGHTLGLQHIDRADDVLAPLACHCDVSFGTGFVIDKDGNTTAEEQDDLALLAEVLLPRGDGAPLCPWDDPHEPDDASAPVALALDETGDALLCLADDDYWTAPVPAGCEAVADVSFTHADGNLWLKMIRPDGTTGARSYSRDDDERAVELVTEQGPPVAHVGAGDTVDNAYSVTFSSHCPEDVGCDEGGDLHEPNDVRSYKATRLYPPAGALGATCEDDVDYFRFIAKKGCTLDVDLYFTDDDGDLDLRLERYDGTRVKSSTSVSDDEHISWAVDRTSILYAKVYGWRGAINDYRIEVATTCE
jgi:hypothetical protein